MHGLGKLQDTGTFSLQVRASLTSSYPYHHKNDPDGLPPVVKRYHFKVTVGDEWPKERETCTKSAPAARAICA